jgi:NAD(P)H dehydrogenase (quinone)
MLIIYSHPNKLGHCGYILEKITDKLSSQNKSFELLDLYEINFDPRLKPEEHYTSGHKNVSPEVIEIQEKIKAHDDFIFIYPTWWGGPPAMLKGFFERVLTHGFAYYYENGNHMDY